MIGAVIAMRNEAEILLKHLVGAEHKKHGGTDIFTGTYQNREVAVAVSGIGKVNAAAATAVLIENHPVRSLVNFGLAGAVNPEFRVLDVMPVTRCMQYDFDLREINGTPLGTLDERASPWFALRTPADVGYSVGTADCFSGDPEAARFLFSLGADLRDMEGAAVAQVAENYGVPLFMWKAVSDVAGKNAAEEFAARAAGALAELEAFLPEMLRAADRG